MIAVGDVVVMTNRHSPRYGSVGRVDKLTNDDGEPTAFVRFIIPTSPYVTGWYLTHHLRRVPGQLRLWS